MQLQLFETDIEELRMLVGVMKVGRSLLHCKLHDSAGSARNLTGARSSIPDNFRVSIARSAYFGIVLA
jgi:hypothetical protein